MTKQESIDYMFVHIGRFDEAMKKLAAGEEEKEDTSSDSSSDVEGENNN